MNPLDQLKDIHLPAEVTYWPPAWPWWLMMLCILALIVFAVWRYKRQAWRREALKQLNDIDWQNIDLAYRQVNKLLKTITVQKLNQKSAQLSGEQWLNFLDRQVKHSIFMPDLRPFAHVLDEPNIQLDQHALKKAVSIWIRKFKC